MCDQGNLVPVICLLVAVMGSTYRPLLGFIHIFHGTVKDDGQPTAPFL